MAQQESRLTFVFDENSGSIANLLRASRAVAHDSIRTAAELGISGGTLDPPLLRSLGEKGPHALITRDSRMLHPLIQRGAWREAGVTLFLLDGRWGRLPLGDMTRRMIFLWPSFVNQAEGAPLGIAWRVAPTVPAVGTKAFRLVTGEHAGQPSA
jgi:hypothetical protein